MNRNNYKNEMYINAVVTFLFIFYLISSTFDLAVTLTIYKIMPDAFLNYEANELFLNTIKEGKPFFMSPAVWLDMLIPVLFILSYEIYRIKKNFFRFTLFFGTTVCCIIIACMHINGGMSWWH